MKAHSRLDRVSDSLLESIVQITGQRDRDSLELSLVKTLHELIASRRIVLHRIDYVQGKRHLLPQVHFEHDEYVLENLEFDEEDETSPLLDDFPDFLASLESRQMVKCRCLCDSEECSQFIYPIFGSADRVVGFLEIDSANHDGVNHKLVGGFLKIYHNYLMILDDSERDTLTGLLNRKTFDNNIAKITSAYRNADANGANPKGQLRRRQMHTDWSHWLAVIDIDFFKSVNDRFGHLYGDEVLLLLARIMEKTFRHNDRLFRFGGEEFVVVLEPASFDNAWSVLERFRKAVESYTFPQVGKVTVSAGFTHIRSDEIPATVVGHADEALYYAKHNGRNRVCSYEKLIEEGVLGGEHYTSEIELF
ncbi:MAG: GGDEF domain-containing protein [Sulfuricella sp.]|nr:GGDEF domain-containing protein [Sulfuricella sp.]